MASFDPTAEELATFTDVGVVAGWLELEDEVLDALKKAAGARTLSLRSWAKIPSARWAAMLLTVKVQDPDADNGERLLSPVEEGQVGELRSILDQLSKQGPSPATGGGGTGHIERGGTVGHPPARPAGAGAGAGEGNQDGGGGHVAARPEQLALTQGLPVQKGTAQLPTRVSGPRGPRRVVGLAAVLQWTL